MSTDAGLVRNLICHIWPVKDRGVWQWNVSQILKRMDLFNGQRVVGVVTDPTTDTLDTVRKAFKGTVTNFVHERNDPTLGEVVSFPELLKRVENIDPRQHTFYCHGKGCKYPADSKFAPWVRRWAWTMYSTLLDHPGVIEESLRHKTMVGTFIKRGNNFGGLPPRWHFPGTFFWFRNDQVFGHPGWHNVPRSWWGTEAWPGIMVEEDAAEALILSDEAPHIQLYQKANWDNRFDAAAKAWYVKHAAHHRANSYAEVLNSLRRRRVVVSGPQRSGTTFAATALSRDLGVPLKTEVDFGTHDQDAFLKLLKDNGQFVVQAPTMSPYLHLLQDVDVVWMRRDLQDVLRSQQRVGWGRYEELERDRYFDHSQDPVAVVKTRAWDLFQRISLGESAWDLDYESLRGHKLWVEPEGRKGFGERQVRPFSPAH